ncbi:MAG TPA: mannitol dehydrogenase family protein [Streptosporangiaceae bacterium]|nr:mannitol dehydrogenase family protein [Streptosporangiaceae bacterium]
MSARRLSRTAGQGRPAAPVRLVHLGLGNFFRAHPCWYTEHAPDAADWGFAAFTGRGSAPMVGDLNEQQGLYTLVSRAADADRFEVLSSLSRAHTAADQDAWLRYFAAPELSAVTITVTEAGYLRGPGGGLDTGRPDVQADIEALRSNPMGFVRTAPARLVAGMAARRRADAGPLALVPCDNTPGNGELAERVVRDLAQLIDAGLAGWLEDSVAVVSTMVDRITPRPAPEDLAAVLEATGFDDRCPVVSEPFHEWVLSGAFPAGRPRWQDAGATFTSDVTPYEHRKLWLLNGAHSLLAYAGSITGHETVAGAAADETCQSWLEEWWTVASPHLNQPTADVATYRAALLERFANTRMHDRLDRIAADGSQKLPIRILPVLRAERAAGRVAPGATRVLAAWVCHLRGLGAPVNDVRASEVVPLAKGPLAEAVPRVLAALDPALGADTDVVTIVLDQSKEFSRPGR